MHLGILIALNSYHDEWLRVPDTVATTRQELYVTWVSYRLVLTLSQLLP